MLVPSVDENLGQSAKYCVLQLAGRHQGAFRARVVGGGLPIDESSKHDLQYLQ